MILEYIEGHLVDLAPNRAVIINAKKDFLKLLKENQIKKNDRDVNSKIILGIFSKHGINRTRDELVIVSQKIAKQIDEWRV